MQYQTEFPEYLKFAGVKPVFKKKVTLDNTNYKPVSVLPPVSKIFERLMQKQMNIWKTNYLLIYVDTGKGYSTHCALLSLIEVGKKSLMIKDLVEQFWYFKSWTTSYKT